MTREQMQARERKLWPLHDELLNDALVHRVAEEYIHGNIATLPECLFQMVKHLSATTDYHRQKQIELMMCLPPQVTKRM